MSKVRYSALAAVLGGGLLCAVAAAYLLLGAPRQELKPAAPYPREFTLPVSHIEAKAAVVYDPTTNRVLYAKNANLPLPLASLTKLMTAEVVLQSKTPKTRVTITRADLAPDGDWGFAVGDTFALGDLLKLGLVGSSNDAMAAAAASVGSNYVSEMNKTAGTLGLTHTYFLNPTGLDLDVETSGAYGSALDVARLTQVFLRDYPDYFEETQKSSVSVLDGSRTLEVKATALPLLTIPGFIGAKTGYTDLAGGNLTAAFDLEVGHPVIVVILGSSEAGRFNDIKTLIEAARAAAND